MYIFTIIFPFFGANQSLGWKGWILFQAYCSFEIFLDQYLDDIGFWVLNVEKKNMIIRAWKFGTFCSASY